jgi:malate synthase
MMTTLNTSAQDPRVDQFRPAVVSENPIQAESIEQQLTLANEFLDRVCPLAHGSHRDVQSYVVYYQHLLAFFHDGQQSGLRQSVQLVGLNGPKEAPSSILLKADSGRHIELIFDPQGQRGALNRAHLDDIQLESSGSVATSGMTGAERARWSSLIGPYARVAQPDGIARDFTGTDGDAYRVA